MLTASRIHMGIETNKFSVLIASNEQDQCKKKSSFSKIIKRNAEIGLVVNSYGYTNRKKRRKKLYRFIYIYIQIKFIIEICRV